jgi:hypothetical protein
MVMSKGLFLAGAKHPEHLDFGSTRAIPERQPQGRARGIQDFSQLRLGNGEVVS